MYFIIQVLMKLQVIFSRTTMAMAGLGIFLPGRFGSGRTSHGLVLMTCVLARCRRIEASSTPIAAGQSHLAAAYAHRAALQFESPETEAFGQTIGHITQANMFIAIGVKGAKPDAAFADNREYCEESICEF